MAVLETAIDDQFFAQRLHGDAGDLRTIVLEADDIADVDHRAVSVVVAILDGDLNLDVV